MKKYFVTATGTGVGKTLITAALTHQLRKGGKKVITLKPVISGFDGGDIAGSDTGILLQAQGLPLSQTHIDLISPWRFAAPLSADMAAKDEGKEIDFSSLVTFCKTQKDSDRLLIEGVGGVMSPLTQTHTVIDWMMALQFPVILVTGSYLGSISHTLTAYNIIVARKLKVVAVIISESEESPVSAERTKNTLQNFLPADIPISVIARLDYSSNLWQTVPNLIIL